jgi:predicted enzyme related to lactoylglutathione lyase
MIERGGYQPGVPCWVETWQRDAEAAVRFYTAVFGWDAERVETPDATYYLCRLGGRDVAGVGASDALGGSSAWTTFVWVESVEKTAATVAEAGGRLVREPFDSLDGGRMAIVADPEGAVLGAWQPGRHRGAELVNAPGAWSWSQLTARNVQAAVAFYRAVFGWGTRRFDAGDGQVLTIWTVPGYVGGRPTQPLPRDVVAGVVPLQDDGSAPRWGIEFWVDDVDEAAAKATEQDGSVVVAPFDGPIGRTAVLRDPGGATLSVSRVIPKGAP